MAKKRTDGRDDLQEAQRWVEAAAESMRVRRWNLTHAAMCVYGRTLVGFADVMGSTSLVDHQDAGVRRVLNTGHQQWTRQTGLPPLDADDNHWRIVAVAAGASDESLRAIENGNRKQLDLLVERIAAWCQSRVADDDGWSDEIDRNDIAKHFRVSTRTIDRWVRESSGPVDISRIRSGWFRYREHRQ
jgi:hypothetical protein